MTRSKILLVVLQTCSLVAVLATPVPDDHFCKSDGEIHEKFEEFFTGVDRCALCHCDDDGFKCDARKCQEIALNQPVIRAEPDLDDYINIKNQLAKQYFADYDQADLRIITEMLGCKTVDCPQLLSVTNINYNVLALDRQEYVGRAKKQNKIVVHSTDAEVVNNSPLQQQVNTVSYTIKVTQYSEATVTKTFLISSEASITIQFFRLGVGFKFEQTNSQTVKTTNETTLEAPSQKVVVDPYTKMNVTFNFYQYEDINNYLLDFEFGLDSTISHPVVDANSNVICEEALLLFVSNI